MMDDTILALFGDYGQIALQIVGVFALLATIIPAPTDDSGKAYKGFYAVICWLAANIGKAKNADAVKNPSI